MSSRNAASDVRLRLARAGEAPGLTALCLRSKAHWGYDAAFLRLCAPALTVSEQSIAEGRVLVAIDGRDRIVGTASVMRDGDDAELGLMFVEPTALGGVASAFAVAHDACRSDDTVAPVGRHQHAALGDALLAYRKRGHAEPQERRVVAPVRLGPQAERGEAWRLTGPRRPKADVRRRVP